MNLIGDRYTISNKLGQGGSSITYAAIDKKTSQQVAIKALSLTGLEDWKKIELFEREAKILQQLKHQCIPQYIDYFQIETENDVYFYIVQQLAPGQSLAHLISQGWIPDEKIVRDIAKQVLEILVYLQQLTPPVIHRDIKPQNIIYQADTGKLFLVDFGAVQDTYHHTVMGSTVVGTYGYMSPEQFRGGATLSTDLYGLGCTLLFLLTGKHPIDLPQKKLKIDFKNFVKIDRNFANWIDKLIEPNVKLRFPKAKAALLVLQEKKPLSDYEVDIVVKPVYSSIKIAHTAEQLTIDIPPLFKRKKVDRIYYFWLVWSIISILNRLAIFVSIGWIGKLYILSWFYNVIVIKNKAMALSVQAFFFLVFFIMVAAGYNLSIPSFSISLILIDFVIDSVLKHNFIQQLLFNTLIKINQDSDCEDSRGHRISVIRKITKYKYKEIFKKPENIKNIPQIFLTVPEQNWVQTEIALHQKTIK